MLEEEFSNDVAKWGIVLLLAFPTSFFFGSVYTESLFLFLTLTSFYFIRKEKFWFAAIFAAFASATRLVGIFLLPILLYEIWRKNKNKFSITNFLPILISGIGLIFYMSYLQKTVNDPFFFFHAQPAFGAGRSGSAFVLLPQVIFRYLKIFITASLSYDYAIAAGELIVFIFAVFLLIKNVKKIRISYQVFAWLTILTPTLTGSLSSMPRYLLNAIPIFILLAQENIKIKFILTIISFLFLVIGTMFFFRGYFIA
jgi:hypothetical protein